MYSGTNQWWRFFSPVMLHSGVLHLLFNLSLQIQAGFALEKVSYAVMNIINSKDMGPIRMAFIYITSGAGGFIFGASLSDIRVASVGASGSLYGTI